MRPIFHGVFFSRGKWVLLDGDKIAALCAAFIHEELANLGLDKVCSSINRAGTRLPLSEENCSLVEICHRIYDLRPRCVFMPCTIPLILHICRRTQVDDS